MFKDTMADYKKMLFQQCNNMITVSHTKSKILWLEG